MVPIRLSLMFFRFLLGSDNDNGGCLPPTSTCPPEQILRTPLKRTVPSSRSSPSDVSRVTNNKKISPKNSDKYSSTPISKLERQKSSNWSVEIAVSNSPSSKFASENNAGGGGSENLGFQENGNSLFTAKRVLYNNVRDEKVNKSNNLRSGSRVVPFEEHDNIQEHESRDSDVTVGSSSEETFGSHKDFEDISLIRDQLRQIENQQSSLLNLLQVCIIIHTIFCCMSFLFWTSLPNFLSIKVLHAQWRNGLFHKSLT